MTVNDLCAQLLPPDDHLHFDTLLIEEQRITVVGALTAPKATCPDCGQPATRIHSGYQRTLADLPWATTAIRLLLSVRRFFCPTPTGERQTFTERLPGVAPRYARTTTRLAAMQAATGLALAGGVLGPASWRARACQGVGTRSCAAGGSFPRRPIPRHTW